MARVLTSLLEQFHCQIRNELFQLCKEENVLNFLFNFVLILVFVFKNLDWFSELATFTTTEPWLYSDFWHFCKISPSVTLFAVLGDLFWLVCWLVLRFFFWLCFISFANLCVQVFVCFLKESDQEMTAREKIDQLFDGASFLATRDITIAPWRTRTRTAQSHFF